MISSVRQYIVGFWQSRVLKADLFFLISLLLLLNYRLSFKILALLLFLFLKTPIKFSFNRVSLFYLALAALGFIHFFLFAGSYSFDRFIIVCCASVFWLAAFWSFQKMKSLIAPQSVERVKNSLRLMVLINLVVSLFDLAKVMLITQTINPYTQVCAPPYGISSGDLIGGVYGGIHLVNTVVSAFLFVFFLYRKEWIYAFCSLLPFLLTGSNLASLLLICFLIWIAIFGPSLLRRYYAIFSLCIIVAFYVKVTPSNGTYMASTLNKIGNQFKDKQTTEADKTEKLAQKPTAKIFSKEELIDLYVQRLNLSQSSDLTKDETKQKADLYGIINEYQNLVLKVQSSRATLVSLRKDSLSRAKMRDAFYEYGKLKKFDLNNESGKITSFKQTFNFLKSNPKHLFLGNGPGAFSSRLAFVTSGIADDSRILKALPHFQSQEFAQNHKAIFKFLMFLDDETHSITNLPFSSYNNFLGEYGLIGFAVFIVLYLFYWLKNWKNLSFGRYLLLLFLAFLFFDYWFERLSVVIIFEILMLIDISEKSSTSADENT